MHGPINVKSPNNISEWQMGFNSAFKGLSSSAACHRIHYDSDYASLVHKVIVSRILMLKVISRFYTGRLNFDATDTLVEASRPTHVPGLHNLM